jgi:diadenosine tetraphosphate (Ap4A) HIT family hydrolase
MEPMQQGPGLGPGLQSRALALPGCPLCEGDGGLLVARLPVCRVIRADERAFPAFYRVVLNDHVAEWSDVPEADQLGVMRVVCTVERVLREQLHPTKVNLAALGNVVPHVHWHVIARFDWDTHFPAPIWAQAQRVVEPGQLSVLAHLLPRVDDALRQRLLPE